MASLDITKLLRYNCLKNFAKKFFDLNFNPKYYYNYGTQGLTF